MDNNEISIETLDQVAGAGLQALNVPSMVATLSVDPVASLNVPKIPHATTSVPIPTLPKGFI